jgi:hypothetical protein
VFEKILTLPFALSDVGETKLREKPMGYTTEFSGHVTIDPPLNLEEINYLLRFADTRRMERENGPYYVDGGGFKGQADESDVIDFNKPQEGQPGLWCQWVPNDEGTEIEWDGGEKFYYAAEWMKYLIDHFLKPGALAASQLPFLQANHTVNGVIEAQGEDGSDRWDLVVEDNVVNTVEYKFTKGEKKPVE